MKLNELRQGIVDVITAANPTIKTVETRPGKFDITDLKRIGAGKIPAALVSILGLPKVTRTATDENALDVRLAVFIITKDKGAQNKDAAALDIVEDLLARIPDNRFGVQAVGVPESVKADNLYSGNLDKTGVAIWAITWSQSVRIGVNEWEGGPEYSAVYINGDSDTFGQAEHYERIPAE